MLVVFGIALSLCGLTGKLKKETSSNDSSKSAPTASNNGAPVERPVPTAAQVAAMSGGQSVSWDQQGISWTVPANWSKTTEESKELVWRSPGSSCDF